MEASVIRDTEERFRSDPDAARATPTVTATLANGRARLSAGPFNWEADLPAALGGTNLAPTPTAYLLGALAGCGVVFVRDTLAPQVGIQIDDVTAVARCSTDARGLLGMDGALPDLADVEIEIQISSSAPQDRIDELRRVWEERCPIYLAISKPNGVALRLTVAEPAATT
jgi:uncharacterized OsmC-like protein